MKWKMLPRGYNRRCVALDSDGKRCRKKATWKGEYHGDGEIYTYFDNAPQWVQVEMCNEHASKCK
ncbi:MAG: hypothetical protein ACWGQW_05410 [bacterium]